MQDTGSDDNARVYDPDSESAAWFASMAGSMPEYTAPLEDVPLQDAGKAIDENVPPVEQASEQPKATATRTGTTRAAKAKPVPDDDAPLVDPEKRQKEKTKTGPPDPEEWLDFFSRIILKVGMNSYIDFAFRNVDEERVSEADLKRIQVTKEERDSIARPFGEYASKNPYTRKHGRQVVALTDSLESLLTLGIWIRRVNRVAKKYKPVKRQTIRPTTVLRESREANGANGQNPSDGISGTTGGYVRGDYGPIINPGGG
jgi:hypothetical protein